MAAPGPREETVDARVLPLRVQPARGEAIDSWLETTAARMHLPFGALAHRLELSAVARPRWILCLSDREAAVLATATGTSSRTVKAMTLATYDGRALQLDAEALNLQSEFPYGPLPGSRYCPDCLSASAGRWQLSWRLGWSFACTQHRRLLADVCPRCDSRPRSQQTYGEIPSPTPCGCGQDLTRTPTALLPPNHPILGGQRRLNALLSNEVATFGVFTPLSPRRAVLETIRSLSNRTLNFASKHGLSSVTAAKLREGRNGPLLVPEQARAQNALNPAAPATAVETAVGVAAALDILDAPSVRMAGYRARWLIEGQNADTGPAELRSCRRDAAMATAIIVRASDARLGPELQLRYRSAISVPCAPDLDRGRAEAMAAALPTVMWPEWSERLLQGIGESAALRSALSIATVVIGSDVRPVEAARMLGVPASANALNSRLWVLGSSTYWRPACAALIRLSDYLCRGRGPIDYSRRRSLDYSALLNDSAWEIISAQIGTSCRDEGARGVITRYLVERLSGQPPAVVPKPAASRPRGRAVAGIAIVHDQRIGAVLDRHARTFLKRNGVNGPVSWCPPLGLLDGLPLPAPK